MAAKAPDHKLSIHDVASEAGVSIATVSRVINGKDRVAPETRQRVQTAMRSLGFRPNRQARSLGLRRTNTIGLVLPDFTGEFFSELMQGVDLAARESRMNVMVLRATSAEEERAIAEELLGTGAVDGLIFMISQLDDRALDSLASHREQLLVIDRHVGHLSIDNVLVDNRSAGYDAARHLIKDSAAQRMLFIGGPEANVDTKDRLAGFREACRRYEVEVGGCHFTSYKYEQSAALFAPLAEEVAATGVRWGVVAANDSLARGVVDAALDAGLSVPGDVAVVGFDDSTLARFSRPALSSVRVPLQELGRTALCLLRDRLNGARIEPACIVFRGRLIPRASSLVPSPAAECPASNQGGSP